jgi:hypothetical protein
MYSVCLSLLLQFRSQCVNLHDSVLILVAELALVQGTKPTVSCEVTK